MPRGGELSSFKVPGVGNLLHSCKKNTNPGGIARGGMVTAGIDPCIMHLSILIPGGKGAGNGWGFNREFYPHRWAFDKDFLPGCG